jgi:hypothetical protein
MCWDFDFRHGARRQKRGKKRERWDLIAGAAADAAKY